MAAARAGLRKRRLKQIARALGPGMRVIDLKAKRRVRRIPTRKPARSTTTTTTTTRRVVKNPRYKAGPLTFFRRADAVAWGKPRGYTARAIPTKRRRTASTRRRKGNPMAKRKRTPAQRAAFRRMIAGLRAYKAGGRKQRRKARRKAKRSTALVVVSNPRRKRRKTKGASHMAKRRRTRRHGTVARTKSTRRRRRNPSHRRRRRRNPGGGGMVSIVKSTIATAIPAIAAGGLMALLDNKVLGDKAMPVQVLGKLAAAAGVGYMLRNRPRTAAVAMGAMLGGLGYQLAAKMGGGVVATNSKDAAKEISALIRQDPRAMAALVRTDGSLNTTPSLSGMGVSMGDGGGTSLPTAPIFDPITLG